jgi:hypothetical protein
MGRVFRAIQRVSRYSALEDLGLVASLGYVVTLSLNLTIGAGAINHIQPDGTDKMIVSWIPKPTAPKLSGKVLSSTSRIDPVEGR